jgi:hypothetical protein
MDVVQSVPAIPEIHVLEVAHKESTTVTITTSSDTNTEVTQVKDVEETITEVVAVMSKDKKAKKEKKARAPAAPKPAHVPFYQQVGQNLFAQSQEEHVLPVPSSSSGESGKRHSATRAKTSTDILSLPKHPFHKRTKSNTHTSDDHLSDNSVSTGSLSDIEVRDPTVNASLKDSLYNLDDFRRLEAINLLIAQYGTVAHMSVRDPSYSFWVNKTRTAAIHFKLLNKVAVLAGDPLCAPSAMPSTLEEFERYCRKAGWKTSVIGASSDLMEIARLKKWPVMRFGTEKVLNPQTNEVLLGKSGKRTIVQCRQLLDPTRGGLTLHAYNPSKGRDSAVEAELTRIYDEWRGDRNSSRDTQAFITVFEMFALPNLMTFIYTKTRDGEINGFAALRKMGTTAHGKYHIDPYIQSADAPRGTSDLLIFASLAYLNNLGVSYLGLGHEPVSEPDVMYNMNSLITNATRKVYKHIFGRLPVGGKETFNSRWKPDEEQEASLYLIFVSKKVPSPKHLLAMTRFANISLRNVVKADFKDLKHDIGGRIRVPTADPAFVAFGSTNMLIEAPRDRPLLVKSASEPAGPSL